MHPYSSLIDALGAKKCPSLGYISLQIRMRFWRFYEVTSDGEEVTVVDGSVHFNKIGVAQCPYM